MRKEIYNDENPIGENLTLYRKAWKVEKSENFPYGIEFAFQVVYERESITIQVVRIDNQMHDGKPGSHIHLLQREKVIWEDIRLYEAESRIIEIGESIMKNIIKRI